MELFLKRQLLIYAILLINFLINLIFNIHNARDVFSWSDSGLMVAFTTFILSGIIVNIIVAIYIKIRWFLKR